MKIKKKGRIRSERKRFILRFLDGGKRRLFFRYFEKELDVRLRLLPRTSVFFSECEKFARVCSTLKLYPYATVSNTIVLRSVCTRRCTATNTIKQNNLVFFLILSRFGPGPYTSHIEHSSVRARRVTKLTYLRKKVIIINSFGIRTYTNYSWIHSDALVKACCLCPVDVCRWLLSRRQSVDDFSLRAFSSQICSFIRSKINERGTGHLWEITSRA